MPRTWSQYGSQTDTVLDRSDVRVIVRYSLTAGTSAIGGATKDEPPSVLITWPHRLERVNKVDGVIFCGEHCSHIRYVYTCMCIWMTSTPVPPLCTSIATTSCRAVSHRSFATDLVCTVGIFSCTSHSTYGFTCYVESTRRNCV